MGISLNEGTRITPTADGVWLETGRERRFVEDPAMVRWLDIVVPLLLTGEHSVDSLANLLPNKQRERVKMAIELLHDVGALREGPSELASNLSNEERIGYDHELRFIAQFKPSSEVRFERFRTCDCRIFGTGNLSLACAQACQIAGVKTVHVSAPNLDAGISRPPGRYARCSATHPAGGDDAPARVEVVFTCRCGDPRGENEDGVLAEAACMPDGGIWFRVRRSSDRRTDSGWDDLERRLTASSTTPSGGIAWWEPTELAATLVANQLVQAAFREIAVRDASTSDRHFSRMDPDTFRTTQHQVLPHPLTNQTRRRDGKDFLHSIDAYRRRPRLEQSTFQNNIQKMTDAHTGIFVEVGNASGIQSPLHVSRVAVNDPLIRDLPHARPRRLYTFGSGIQMETSRQNAALHAVALYGALAFDTRELVAAEVVGRDAFGLGAPQVSGDARFAWGFDLVSERAVPLDVRQACPSLERQAALPPGIAAGLDWEEAVTAGLAARCRSEALRRLPGFAETFPQVDPATALLGADGAEYLDIIFTRSSMAVHAYDLTELIGVPTVYLAVNGLGVSCAAGPSISQALEEGLHDLLLSEQAFADSESRYAPLSVPPLPESLRGDLRQLDEHQHKLEAVDLARSLSDCCGMRAIAVPLDHDREMCLLMPHAVHVVIVSG